MSNLTNAVCFTCGLVIESPPRLSRLTNGQVCPACRERVLEELPPALPNRSSDTGATQDSRHAGPDGEALGESGPESDSTDWNSAS